MHTYGYLIDGKLYTVTSSNDNEAKQTLIDNGFNIDNAKLVSYDGYNLLQSSMTL